MFDEQQLPVPDLGLVCKGCGYPLGSLLEHRCPECGRSFALADYVPEGLMPPLFAGGEQIKATPEVVELLDRYQIPYQEIRSTLENLGHPGISNLSARPIGVARDDYLWAIDLLRRLRQDEPMPEPPAPQTQTPWNCVACNEENPGNFGVCWNCQQPHGGES